MIGKATGPGGSLEFDQIFANMVRIKIVEESKIINCMMKPCKSAASMVEFLQY